MSAGAVEALPAALGFEHDFYAFVLLIPEDLVTTRRILEVEAVRNYKRWINFAAFDALQQRLHVFVNVSLTHLQCQAFGERGAEWDRVE